VLFVDDGLAAGSIAGTGKKKKKLLLCSESLLTSQFQQHGRSSISRESLIEAPLEA